MEKEQENNIQKSLDTIAQTTAYILENMATKDDLAKVESNLQGQINGLQIQTNSLEVDLRSFKQETSKNFKEVNEKLEDILDTHTNFDKRLEKLEEKVFA